jgi:hypothetical protein
MTEIKKGDPLGHDPLVIARTMAQHGIVLVSHLTNDNIMTGRRLGSCADIQFMVACEDTLSAYKVGLSPWDWDCGVNQRSQSARSRLFPGALQHDFRGNASFDDGRFAGHDYCGKCFGKHGYGATH